MSQVLVVFGTYNGSILGIQGGLKQQETVFAKNYSSSCIKSLDLQPEYLLAGSFDEMVRVFDPLNKLELGTLLEGQGTVNVVKSTTSHFITGNDKGTISIWRFNDLKQLKSFQGHRAAVTGLSIHPSEKLAISVGRDKRMVLWDLVRGKIVFKTKFYENILDVVWQSDGKHYFIQQYSSVRYYSVKSNTRNFKSEYQNNAQIQQCVLQGNLAIMGDVEGNIIVWNPVNKGSIVFQLFDARIGGIKVLEVGKFVILIAVTTNGFMKIANVTALLGQIQQEEELALENVDDLILTEKRFEIRVSALDAMILNENI